MAQTLIDAEFGAIRVKRVHTTRHVRLKIAADGLLVATLPNRAPLRLVKELVDASRQELRHIVSTTKQTHQRIYANGEQIGASHSLRFIYGDVAKPRAVIRGQMIFVTIPPELDAAAPESQEAARSGVIKALRKEASAYLPRRLKYLAEEHGFDYSAVRFSNAKGRWGSCSNSGTISLNIALMNMPTELIDYILVHELCHTREMNHSTQFWDMVGSIDPQYMLHKRSLKSYTPYL